MHITCFLEEGACLSIQNFRVFLCWWCHQPMIHGNVTISQFLQTTRLKLSYFWCFSNDHAVLHRYHFNYKLVSWSTWCYGFFHSYCSSSFTAYVTAIDMSSGRQKKKKQKQLPLLFPLSMLMLPLKILYFITRNSVH